MVWPRTCDDFTGKYIHNCINPLSRLTINVTKLFNIFIKFKYTTTNVWMPQQAIVD
jgi:hypothetical protein